MLARLADAMVLPSRLCQPTSQPTTQSATEPTPSPIEIPRPESLAIGLVGTLGAGKTRFCQEISRSLGSPPGEVTSPTFTLIRTYEVKDEFIESPRHWHHLDLYRVADDDEFFELGIEELWDQSDAWTIIEWADRFESLMPESMVWIEISIPEIAAHAGLKESTEREIRFHCDDPERTSWIEAVVSRVNQ